MVRLKNSLTKNRMCSDANIVHCPISECAVAKVLREGMNTSSRVERQTLYKFRVCNGSEIIDENDRPPFLQSALKRQRLQYQNCSSSYKDSRFLIPTSNIDERLFSKVGLVLTGRLMRL